MSVQPLDELMQRLGSGDDSAAEVLFRVYEPYLRKVARRQLPRLLRAKFDSRDVVQSVWAHFLQGLRDTGWHFADSAHLRAFLATMTRHRVTDRIRHFHHVLERERSLADTDAASSPGAAHPRSSDLVRGDDLWARLMVLCRPEHRELLRLKRQGLRLAEIAARTGLHEGNVRRILRKLARQLAFETTN